MSATEVTTPAEVQHPASTTGEVKSRKVKGETKLFSICSHCGRELELTAENWYPHRASGRLHNESRCRSCDREYRGKVAAATKSGEHVCVARGSGKTPEQRAERIAEQLAKAEARVAELKEAKKAADKEVVEAKKAAEKAEREAKEAEAKAEATPEAGEQAS